MTGKSVPHEIALPSKAGLYPSSQPTLAGVLSAVLDTKADATVTTSALAGKAATSHGHVVADTSGLQAELDSKVGSTLAYINTTVPAGNTVANTSSETAFASSVTFAANSWVVGDVIKVRLYGTYSTDGILAPTLRGKLKLGGATLLDTSALTAIVGTTNRGWWVEALLVVHAIGASGSIEVQGFAEFSTAVTVGLMVNLANTSAFAFDTTAALPLTITVQWSAADTDNSITLRQLLIEKLRS